MSAKDLSGTTAIVTGASRGFGRDIAIALHAAGAHVAGVARDRAPLDELRAEPGDAFTPVAADAARAGLDVEAYLKDRGPPRVCAR